MAAAAVAQGTIYGRRRKPCWTGTPEIYFAKAIDNSRLVKIEDPRRGREMRQFGFALCCLFMLVMTYTWQHFKAEMGTVVFFCGIVVLNETPHPSATVCPRKRALHRLPD